MPSTPYYSQYQFLSAANSNATAGTVSGSIAQVASGLSSPGLIHPEAVTLAATGLAVTVNAPLPFQTLFGSGVMATASGTTTGVVSSTYSVNFSGVVPTSGAAVTAYLLASYASIQEGSTQIIGPPPGHPDYNPAFSPYTAYTSTVDSLAMAASLTAPDNLTTFEIARCTLTSGATGVGTLSTAYQQRASSRVMPVSGSNVLPVSGYGGRTVVLQTSGTTTLWPAASGNGLSTTFISTASGTCTIQTSGTDLIYGSSVGNTSSGVSLITLAQGASVTLADTLGIWQVQAGSASSSQLTFIERTGTSYAYGTADQVYYTSRANSGTSMTDTLPGNSLPLPASWSTTIRNDDPTANITLSAQGGTGTLTFVDGLVGNTSSTLIIQAGQTVRLQANTTAGTIEVSNRYGPTSFQNSWNSGLFSFAASTEYTLSHNLGVTPSMVQVWAVCTTANATYGIAVGDKVLLSAVATSTSGGGVVGASIWVPYATSAPSTTTLVVSMASSTLAFYSRNGTFIALAGGINPVTYFNLLVVAYA